MEMPRRARGLRVLIVDDETLIRDNLAVFLEDEHFAVRVAHSAEQALAELEQESADVAIVDIRLTGMDGNSFILAAQRQDPGLRFLIHTGSLEYALPPELRALGLSERHVLRKPVADMDLLVQAIRGLGRKLAS